MKVETTPIAGLLVFEPQVFADPRGSFMESWNRTRYGAAGIGVDFVQGGLSRSNKGVLRGLHYTVKRPQAQFVWVSSGEIFDVAVDLRQNSPTFGQWFGIRLNGETIRQLFLPPGFAHGFCVLSERADVHYQMTHHYQADDEYSLNWADPDLAIQWPVANPMIKDHDAQAPRLLDLPPSRLPQVGYQG